MEDDQFDLEEAGEETDAESLESMKTATRRLIEGIAIADILAYVARLPLDLKARALKAELDAEADGFDQTMVFTGATYTTVDGLRDWIRLVADLTVGQGVGD